jgi:putative endonuclease
MIRRAKKTSYSTDIGVEALCRLALRLKGYGIVAARYTSKLGEIGIVTWRGHSLALVELTARPSREIAAEAILRHPRARLGFYCPASRVHSAPPALRYDAGGVVALAGAY